MNFKIFRNFSRIFLNLFDFYFDFKIFKSIKKIAKIWVSSRVYTWYRHVDRSASPRGADVTRGAYFIFNIYNNLQNV